MITLIPTNLHWLAGLAETADLCAHGDVDFQINGEIVVESTIGGHYAVGAAALYLLRSLSLPHRFAKDTKHGQPLFPHCGHSMFASESTDDVVIMGCPHGADLELRVAADEVTIHTGDGRNYRVTFAEWKIAVCQFSDAVQDFYESSLDKDMEISDQHEVVGYERFRSEWSRRRAFAEGEDALRMDKASGGLK